MRPLAPALTALLLSASFACGSAEDTPDCSTGRCDSFDTPVADRHVQLIHVDGFRPDVFKTLLDRGMLPHFEYLLTRGKVSYEASTVDKSETMKVIQSYLTGRADTHVVGWWQFNRSDYRFRNFWLDPAEVVNYAVGLKFPVYPTIQDILAADGHNLTAGLSLARRGVPFNNYGRPYYEGAKATTDHSYFKQAHATANSQIEILKRIAKNKNEFTPKLSHLLLAPADEFAHADGIVGGDGGEHCFGRGNGDTDDAIFEIINDDRDRDIGGHVKGLLDRYFTDISHSFLGLGSDVDEICIPGISLPLYVDGSLPGSGDTIGPETLEPILPEYILGMIVVDMELGYLMNTLRSYQFDDAGEKFWQDASDLGDYMKDPAAENTLFDRTLFLITGDHGMVDSKSMHSPPESQNQFKNALSVDTSFIDYLNGELGLTSEKGNETIPENAELGVEFSAMPNRMNNPHRFADWQDAQTLETSQAATDWASLFFMDLGEAVRSEAHKKYWWLFMLRGWIVDPKIDSALAPIENVAIHTMAEMYLQSEPEYQAAELAGNRAFFDQHVRMVYGGGARNNAEIFLPVCDETVCSWDRRPSLEEVFEYRGGQASKGTVIDALMNNPGAGLIFVRQDNELISKGAPLPEKMTIHVLDTSGNTGRIRVHKDAITHQTVYYYEVDSNSAKDPLGYESVGSRNGVIGTYNEWLELTGDKYYHNVVAGIGSYLYSNNPSIGDILVMHAQGWNFGENSAGHGGIHRGEKQTVMIASAPGMKPGILKSHGRWETTESGKVIITDKDYTPTVLDIAPTIMNYLGYDPYNALPDFAKSGAFKVYLEDWVSRQEADIIGNLGGIGTLQDALEDVGFEDFRIIQFTEQLRRLLEFAFTGIPELPDYSDAVMDGNVLKLN
jgi:hypothetical protein